MAVSSQSIWISAFFEVTLRTIENYLGQHGEELAQNGYEILKGNRLKTLKKAISGSGVPETDFGNISKAPQLGVFDFRAFLNLAMLITESERARLLRQMILDIVIDTMRLLKIMALSFPNGLKNGLTILVHHQD